jgi:hypothetical protein
LRTTIARCGGRPPRRPLLGGGWVEDQGGKLGLRLKLPVTWASSAPNTSCQTVPITVLAVL